jgi:uncharacterized membrane protein YhfC
MRREEYSQEAEVTASGIRRDGGTEGAQSRTHDRPPQPCAAGPSGAESSGQMDALIRLLNAGLMIALPLALGVVVARHYGVPWTLFGWGAVTFAGSQVVHLPLLQVLTLALRGVDDPAVREHTILANALILGVAAGVCEEGARYLGYRYLVPGARSWEQGVMLGTGHGGTEAIILGAITGVATLRMMAGDPAMPEVAALAAAPTTMRALPDTPLAPLLGAVERLFAITNHLALSVMVLQAFVRGSWRWLLAAIGWHAALDGSSVYLASRLSPLALEAVLGGFAVAALGILGRLRPRRSAA